MPETEPASVAAGDNPLTALQHRHGGQFVEFGGRRTPVRYAEGILKEHLHARAAAGLFDVSHMNQVRIAGEASGSALEALLPTDAVSMPVGLLRYTTLTRDDGGIIDDLIIGRADQHSYEIVSNACRAAVVNDHLRRHLGGDVSVKVIEDHCLLALQGPKARAALASLLPESATLSPMRFAKAAWRSSPITLACAGYTGEDGFEVSLPQDLAADFASALLAQPEVSWCGLGSRDSLRLEAGLCLYGNDIDESITPVEAGLSWTIAPARRSDGERAGGFPGAERILSQMAARSGLARRRGLRGEGQGVAREGTALFTSPNSSGKPIGKITSGGYAPILKSSIAMAYLPPEYGVGATVYAQLRGRMLPYQVCPLPFYKSSHLYSGKQ